MFAKLPKRIQEQILYYLEANNFQAAKELRDQYFPALFSTDLEASNWDSKELQLDVVEII